MMRQPYVGGLVSEQVAKIGIVNAPRRRRSLVVNIEPEGEDYTLECGDELEVYAKASGQTLPWFETVVTDDAITVWINGPCDGFFVLQNGQLIFCGHKRGL